MKQTLAVLLWAVVSWVSITPRFRTTLTTSRAKKIVLLLLYFILQNIPDIGMYCLVHKHRHTRKDYLTGNSWLSSKIRWVHRQWNTRRHLRAFLLWFLAWLFLSSASTILSNTVTSKYCQLSKKQGNYDITFSRKIQVHHMSRRQLFWKGIYHQFYERL